MFGMSFKFLFGQFLKYLYYFNSNKSSWINTSLEKSFTFGLPCVSFVNVYQFVCVVLSLLALKV